MIPFRRADWRVWFPKERRGRGVGASLADESSLSSSRSLESLEGEGSLAALRVTRPFGLLGRLSACVVDRRGLRRTPAGAG